MSSWAANGESLWAWVRSKPSWAPGNGLHLLGTRALLLGSSFDESPAGSHVMVGLFVPVRMGLRVGLSAVTVVYSTREAQADAAERWGFPSRVGALGWNRHDDRVIVDWVDQSVTVEAELGGWTALPVVAPARVIQRRVDGRVLVNAAARGRSRRAMVSVRAGAEATTPIADTEGIHRGHHVAGLRFSSRRARRPVGRAFSLPAPLRPDGAIASMSGSEPTAGAGVG